MKQNEPQELEPGAGPEVSEESSDSYSDIPSIIVDQADQISATQEYAAENFDIRGKKFRLKNMARYLIVAVIFTIITLLTPIVLPVFPLWSIIPAIFLLVYIFLTKQVFESLTLGIVLGFLMVSISQLYLVEEESLGFFDAVNYSLISNMANEDTVWLFIVCGLMGSFVALIEKAGGVYAFGAWVAKRAKTRKSTLLWTWILGLIIFVDDYLNSLTVGSCMAPLTDKHKVSREYLSYVVDSTAAPDTTLIPVSTWAVFIVGLFASALVDFELVNTGAAAKQQAWNVFLMSIPFNFYAWLCLLMVPLTIFGVIPLFGKMKKAEKRAKETGVLAPPGSEKIDIRAGEALTEQKNAKVRNFFIPILILIVTTILFGLGSDPDTGKITLEPNLQYGIIFTLGFMFIFYLVQGLLDADEFFTLVIKGFKNMLMPLVMVVLAYMFADGLEKLGFMEYVATAVTGNVPIWLLPAIIFLVFGFTEFIMGLSWGMYAIAIPVIATITLRWPGLETNQIFLLSSMSIAAVVSAGVWGSHICFYSDATILSSSAAGCDNYEHATSQLPYGLIAAVASLVAFIIAGFAFFG